MNRAMTNLAKKLATAGFTTLGGAVAGPAGAAAVGVIAKRLGAAEADPDVVAQAIEADPEATVRLRELDLEMRKAENEHVERVLADEAAIAEKEEAARQASVAAARAATSGHWLTPVLTLILIGMIAAFGLALFLVEPPASNRDLVNFLLGNISGWVGAGVAYWLGSSRGSADRSATIDRIITRK